jgi:opacity protein-like surface antigen
MRKIALAVLSAAFAATLLIAQAAQATPTLGPAADCEAKAIGKTGKPLAGAAKTSFMKKCEADAKAAGGSDCESKAVGKNRKPLAGAAKTSFMKKCETDQSAGK